MLGRIGATISGFVLMTYGILAAFTPLPAGAPLVIIGLLMIAGANPAARPVIVRMRRRWPWFHRLVKIIGNRAPRHIAKVAHATEPGSSDEPGEAEKP